MILKLETERLSTLDEVREFVVGSAAVDFAGVDRESTYEFVKRTLVRFDYGRLGRPTRGCCGVAWRRRRVCRGRRRRG